MSAGAPLATAVPMESPARLPRGEAIAASPNKASRSVVWGLAILAAGTLSLAAAIVFLATVLLPARPAPLAADNSTARAIGAAPTAPAQRASASAAGPDDVRREDVAELPAQSDIASSAVDPGIDTEIEDATEPLVATEPDEVAPADPPPAVRPRPVRPRQETDSEDVVSLDFQDLPWKVEVDPPATTWTSAVEELSTRLLYSSSTSKFLFPSAASSPYVAVRQIGEPVKIYDLETGRFDRKFNVKPQRDTLAVSSDGERIAALDAKFLTICEVGEAEPLIVKFEDAKQGNEFLAFASLDLVHSTGNLVTVFDPVTGKRRRQLKLGRPEALQAAAVSPGGRFLALCAPSGGVALIDLDEWTSAGMVMAIPDKVRRLAFSGDGAKLAALTADSQVICWDMARGAELYRREFDRDLGLQSRDSGRNFQWLVDGSGWLVQRSIVDEASGAVVVQLPEAHDRLIADRKRMLVVDRSGNRRDNALRLEALPQEQIATGRAAAAAGGQLADVGLPPLTRVDLTGAKAIDITAPCDWSVQPDPAPPVPAGLLDKPVLLPVPISAAVQTYLGFGDTPQAVVALRTGDDRLDIARSLLRVDLATGEKLGEWNLPGPAFVMDVSPDGSRVALSREPQSGRVDIYSLPAGKFEAAWRPSPPTRGFPVPHLGSFLDSEHIMATSWTGLSYWKLPGCECLAQCAASRVPYWPVVSPGRRYLASVLEREVVFFDTRRNSIAGRVTASSYVNRSAFHPSGNKLAALSSEEGEFRVTVWNLEDGKRLSEVALPASASGLAWCDDCLLAQYEDHCLLIDPQRSLVLWKYEHEHAKLRSDSPDSRCWVLLKSQKRIEWSQPVLCAFKLPEPFVSQVTADARATEPLLKRADRVAIEISVADKFGKEEQQTLRKTAAAALARAFAKRGFVADKASDLRMVFTFGMEKTEDVLRINNVTHQQIIPVYELTTTVALQYGRQAEVVWQREIFKNRTTSENLFAAVGSDLAAHCYRKQAIAAADSLGNFSLPSTVLPPEVSHGLGKSKLTVEGPIEAEQNEPLPERPRIDPTRI